MTENYQNIRALRRNGSVPYSRLQNLKKFINKRPNIIEIDRKILDSLFSLNNVNSNNNNSNYPINIKTAKYILGLNSTKKLSNNNPNLSVQNSDSSEVKLAKFTIKYYLYNKKNNNQKKEQDLINILKILNNTPYKKYKETIFNINKIKNEPFLSIPNAKYILNIPHLESINTLEINRLKNIFNKPSNQFNFNKRHVSAAKYTLGHYLLKTKNLNTDNMLKLLSLEKGPTNSNNLSKINNKLLKFLNNANVNNSGYCNFNSNNFNNKRKCRKLNKNYFIAKTNNSEPRPNSIQSNNELQNIININDYIIFKNIPYQIKGKQFNNTTKNFSNYEIFPIIGSNSRSTIPIKNFNKIVKVSKNEAFNQLKKLTFTYNNSNQNLTIKNFTNNRSEIILSNNRRIKINDEKLKRKSAQATKQESQKAGGMAEASKQESQKAGGMAEASKQKSPKESSVSGGVSKNNNSFKTANENNYPSIENLLEELKNNTGRADKFLLKINGKGSIPLSSLKANGSLNKLKNKKIIILNNKQKTLRQTNFNELTTLLQKFKNGGPQNVK